MPAAAADKVLTLSMLIGEVFGDQYVQQLASEAETLGHEVRPSSFTISMQHVHQKYKSLKLVQAGHEGCCGRCSGQAVEVYQHSIAHKSRKIRRPHARSKARHCGEPHLP